MSKVTVKLQQLPHGTSLPLPEYATLHSAGVDLMAAIESDIVLKSLERKLIPTGIAIALPDNFEAQIRPRSGLAFKNGVSVANTPGTIDADYRGEIKVLLINLGADDFTVTPGMRIAQMVVAPVSRVTFEVASSLDESDRGAGGFGSTGVQTPENKKVAVA